MARYNEILVGHLNRGLQKHLSMKGEPPAPQLSSEIQTSLQLFNGHENRYIFGWNRFAISGSVTEAGGVSSTRFRLRNPVGGNGIAVLEKIACSSSAAPADTFLMQLGANATDLPTVLTAQRLDARIITGNSSMRVSTDTAGGPGSPQIGLMSALTNTTVDAILEDDQEIVVAPGDAFEINPTSVAAATVLRFWVMWRERFLEDSERT